MVFDKFLCTRRNTVKVKSVEVDDWSCRTRAVQEPGDPLVMVLPPCEEFQKVYRRGVDTTSGEIC